MNFRNVDSPLVRTTHRLQGVAFLAMAVLFGAITGGTAIERGEIREGIVSIVFIVSFGAVMCWVLWHPKILQAIRLPW
jgi:hypothetical protein